MRISALMPKPPPRKPSSAQEPFALSKGTLKCGAGVLGLALIIGISHLMSPSEDAAASAPAGGSSAGGAVTSLDDSNFDQFVASHPEGVLVDFYTESCKFCKKLEPEYEKAAKELKASGGPPLAKLDSELGPQVAQKLGLTRYPTVFWFWQGENVLELPRASEKPADKIVEWARWATSPAVQELDTRQEFDEALVTLRQTLHVKARLMVAFNRECMGQGCFGTTDEESMRDAFEAAAQRHRATTVFLYIKEVPSGDPYNNPGPFLRSYGGEESKDEDYQGPPLRAEVTEWVKGILDKAKPPKTEADSGEDANKVADDAKSSADKAIEQVQEALKNAEASGESAGEGA